MSFDGWVIAAIAVKAVTYAATFGAAGGVWFLVYSGGIVYDADLLHRQILWMVGALVAAAVLASAAQILVTAGSMSGDVAGMFDPSLMRMVWDAGAGRACSIRIAGLGLSLLAIADSLRPAARMIAKSIAVAGAALAATSFAWVGHTHEPSISRAAVLLAAVHLSCVAFWLGALMPLYLAAQDAPRRVAARAERFVQVAVPAVCVLLAAGLALLWSLLGELLLMWSSSYGRWALLKIAAVACLLSAAAFNKFRLTPRLLAGDASAVHVLRRSIRIELSIAVIILLLTAALTTVSGPHSA